MFKALDNLTLYLENKLNVMLSGRHGVGKSTIVLELFEKYFSGKYLYFSTSTLDPWIDLIGVPREQKNEKGEVYLDLLRPKFFENDSLEAILFDEVNRAPAKVRNAIMELVQFHSINGHKFNNLKVVWACMNPEDDKDYDTERLDKAFLDRFHINIDLPYIVDQEYFEKKYGSELAGSAIEWWNELDINIKHTISPRRLDYALTVWNIHGNLKDVLPNNSNVSKLLENLKIGSMATRVNRLLNEYDEEVIKKDLENPNMVSYIAKNLTNPSIVSKFVKFLPEELIMREAPNNYEMCSYIKSNMNQFEPSLISSLDGQGCFKESSFKELFNIVNNLFPNSNYLAKDRPKIKKILKAIPNIDNIKIRQSDIATLNKTINLIGSYTTISNSDTIDKDNKEFNFIEKMAILDDLNTKNQYGLDFNSHTVIPLKLKIEEFKKQNKAPSIQSIQMGAEISSDPLGSQITINTADGMKIIGNTVQVSPSPEDGQYTFTSNAGV